MQYVRYGLIGHEKQGVLVQKNQESFVISLEQFNLSNQEDIATLFNPDTIDTIRETLSELNNIHEKLIPVQKIRLGPPVKAPSKIIAVGRNYRDHAKEMNAEVSKNPILFSKASSSIIGPTDQIRIPDFCKKPDWEVELAIVIGKKTQKISKSNAFDYIGGYMVLNDVSGRDAQHSDGQWFRAKSFDTFCPIGPILATKDEIPNPNSLKLWSKINGTLKQESTTANMIFNVETLLEFISAGITLLPGDIIATGTPSGVGYSRDPPEFLQSGDTVEVGIQDLGSQRCKVL